MGSGVALSQVQELIRENAALRQERDRLVQLLAALGHADDEGAFALNWHPAKVSLSRWPAIPFNDTVSHTDGHPDDLPSKTQWESRPSRKKLLAGSRLCTAKSPGAGGSKTVAGCVFGGTGHVGTW